MADLSASTWASGRRRAPGWGAYQQSGHPSHSTSGPVPPYVTRTTSDPSSTPPIPDQYDKLFRRLEWKAQSLLHSHQIASPAIPHAQSDHDTASHRTSPETAMTQFHLDFFEFYSLLERTLRYVLAVFRIFVTESRGAAHHNFHQQVLLALDQPGELHEVLGTGEVREWLGFAKDVRNRWKDPEEDLLKGKSHEPWTDFLMRAPSASKESAKTIGIFDGANDVVDVTRECPSADLMKQMLGSIVQAMGEVMPLVEAQMKKKASYMHPERTTAPLVNDKPSTEAEEHMAMELDDSRNEPFEVLSDEMEIG